MIESSAKRLTLGRTHQARKSFWIRTVAGPGSGFGHLRRTLILAEHLRSVADAVFLLDPEDHGSKEQVAASEFQQFNFLPRKPWLPIEPPAALLIDTRHKRGLNLLIDEAHRHAVPVASIHDLGLAPLSSDVIIDGSIGFDTTRFPANCADCFTGPAYLVLDDACARFHRQPKPIRERIQKVVVNLGGGDGSRFFPRVLEGLRAVETRLEVTGFPGFCSWGQEEVARNYRLPLRFRWIAPDEDAIRLMFQADLVISAGGLSAYEALAVGTPVCALSYDCHQQAAVSALAAAGACLELGRGALLRSRDVLERFVHLNGSPELRRKLSACGRGLVDGRGSLRVARILRSLIDGASCSPDGTRLFRNDIPFAEDHRSNDGVSPFAVMRRRRFCGGIHRISEIG